MKKKTEEEEEYGCKQCQKLLKEKKIKIKEYGKQYRQEMSEKHKQKKKKIWKDKEKIVPTMKKIKENNELKSVEVDVLTPFIKDEVESFPTAEVYTDDNDYEEDRVVGCR